MVLSSRWHADQMKRCTLLRSSPRSNNRALPPHSIFRIGGATLRMRSRRSSRGALKMWPAVTSFTETKSPEVMQTEHRHQKGKPHRIGTVEEEALQRRQI